MALSQLTTVAAALRDCLCAQLEAVGGGPVCQCCLRPGMAPPPADNCCDCGEAQGQASVQVTEIYPSDKFPRKGIQEWTGACVAGKTLWVAELTMTVYRCVAVPNEDGSFPSCEQLNADALKIQADAVAMIQTFTCCDWHPGNKRVMPGSWQPLPNLGGCGGGMMPVFVSLGYDCCPVVG
jgi:hypothetical protein